jgi:pilus assembly protein CpaC
LVTESGRPAHFLSGGQIAVPEPSDSGTSAVEFKEFGTQLNFLPVDMGNGTIHLDAEVIVNTLNRENGKSIRGTFVPGFNTQSCHATADLKPQQTITLTTLVQEVQDLSGATVSFLGFPFPRESEKGLIILVTPYVVNLIPCDEPRH